MVVATAVDCGDQSVVYHSILKQVRIECLPFNTQQVWNCQYNCALAVFVGLIVEMLQ